MTLGKFSASTLPFSWCLYQLHTNSLALRRYFMFQTTNMCCFLCSYSMTTQGWWIQRHLVVVDQVKEPWISQFTEPPVILPLGTIDRAVSVPPSQGCTGYQCHSLDCLFHSIFRCPCYNMPWLSQCSATDSGFSYFHWIFSCIVLLKNIV